MRLMFQTLKALPSKPTQTSNSLKGYNTVRVYILSEEAVKSGQ